jgi:hypothetical protein
MTSVYDPRRDWAREDAAARRHRGYAAKWRADIVHEGIPLAPTDTNLAAVLGGCVRPPHAEDYTGIRAALADWPAEPLVPSLSASPHREAS